MMVGLPGIWSARCLAFGNRLKELVREYNEGLTREAKLAHDADQLAFILELKELVDIGYQPPNSWLGNVMERVKTKTGRKIAAAIMDTRRDEWWLDVTT